MFAFLYNNVAVFLIFGIFVYSVLWFLCNIFYKKQEEDLLNAVHSGVAGVLDPMLRFTENYGNIKIRGFGSLLIYLVFGIVDLFVDAFWLNTIFSLFLLIGAFNGFTLLVSLSKSLSQNDYLNESGRFLKNAYISLFIYRVLLYIIYIFIFAC